MTTWPALRVTPERRARLRRMVLPALALLLSGLAIHEGWVLAQALRFNRAIAEGAVEPLAMTPAPAASVASSNAGASPVTSPTPVSRSEPAPMLFVHAWRAARLGRHQDALALYTAAAADPRIATAALYNSGNVHLREALALAERNALAQTPAPIELAKRQFREALRSDPTYWPAKYNLERALRLSPEVEDDAAMPAPLQSERAVTTMRGFTLGLP